MEFVKHHVYRSGNTTIKGFFSSDAVDFDPPSESLRQNITKAKAKVIYDLANGSTDNDDERAICDLMKTSESSDELIRMVAVIGGWEGLDDELPEAYVDVVAKQLMQVLDQRDYVVYQLVRRYLALLDYNASPNLGDCFARLLQWPLEFQSPEIDLLLTRKVELLEDIASATLRQRTNMIDAARIHPSVIAQYLAAGLHPSNELIPLMHEANYITRICASLANLDYQPLYSIIVDMVDSAKTDIERTACRDACQRLTLAFSAAAKAVEVLGSNSAKATVNRFMAALKLALDNFPATVPAPSVVQTITAALGGVGDKITDLLTAIADLPDALAGAITLPSLLDTGGDDDAEELIGELNVQGWLPHLSFTKKLDLVEALLDGWTVDDDEIGIIRVMDAAKAHDQAELYQLASAATWEALYTSVDGDEYDTLLNILQQPT